MDEDKKETRLDRDEDLLALNLVKASFKGLPSQVELLDCLCPKKGDRRRLKAVETLVKEGKILSLLKADRPLDEEEFDLAARKLSENAGGYETGFSLPASRYILGQFELAFHQARHDYEIPHIQVRSTLWDALYCYANRLVDYLSGAYYPSLPREENNFSARSHFEEAAKEGEALGWRFLALEGYDGYYDRKVSDHGLYANSEEAPGNVDRVISSRPYPKKHDYGECFSYLLRGDSLGDPYCAFLLGIAYFAGKGIEKDFEKAYECFQKAVRLGVKKAALGLFFCLYFGLDTPRDERKASAYLHSLAKAEDGDALDLFALLEGGFDGKGHRVDDPSRLFRIRMEDGYCPRFGPFIGLKPYFNNEADNPFTNPLRELVWAGLFPSHLEAGVYAQAHLLPEYRELLKELSFGVLSYLYRNRGMNDISSDWEKACLIFQLHPWPDYGEYIIEGEN